MVTDTDVPAMEKAVNVIYDMSEDASIREMARLREKAMFDEASALENAERKGIEEGIEKERLRMVEKMRKRGMTEEEINRILNIEL